MFFVIVTWLVGWRRVLYTRFGIPAEPAFKQKDEPTTPVKQEVPA